MANAKVGVVPSCVHVRPTKVIEATLQVRGKRATQSVALASLAELATVAATSRGPHCSLKLLSLAASAHDTAPSVVVTTSSSRLLDTAR